MQGTKKGREVKTSFNPLTPMSDQDRIFPIQYQPDK